MNFRLLFDKNCYSAAFSFGGLILQFVRLDSNCYCGYQKKQYLCIVVDQRVVLKLSQLIGY